MFRFLLPILALSAVAYGGLLPEALSDDLLPEENSDDVFPEVIDSNVYPEVIDSNVYPEELDSDVYPEVIDSNVYPEVIDSNVYPEELDSDVYPEELDSDVLPEELSYPSRIVGGSNTAITTVPWQLFMRINGGFGCGAVLISSTWALSAAHCTLGRASTSNTVLVAGTANRLSGGQVRQVSRIINHPSYNARTIDNDICLMRVATAFSLSTSVRAASLPAQGAVFSAGTYGIISGWGATREGGSPLPTTLQSARVPVFNQATCRANYATQITNNMICAGYARGGRDSCQGDSGGPFAIGGVVAGITSFGRGCARPNFPGVYARVAVYRNWIRTNAGV